jgi:hypothetical protein
MAQQQPAGAGVDYAVVDQCKGWALLLRLTRPVGPQTKID